MIDILQTCNVATYLVLNLTVNDKETVSTTPVLSPLWEQIETNNQPHTPD
jgi:hypothetical protein